jgi:hypothetical protein
MGKSAWTVGAVFAFGLAAGTAFADDAPPAGEPRAEDGRALTAREIRRSLDRYFEGASGDAALVGGPGVAGFDDGFWLRAGPVTFRTGLLVQTRLEGFDWDDREDEAAPGGDLSGFSLPRVTWWVGGEADCHMAFYAELEFGHAVTPPLTGGLLPRAEGVPGFLAYYSSDLPVLREAWIGWHLGGLWFDWGGPRLSETEYPGLQFGIVRTAGPRQLMTPPAFQQFADVGIAAGWIGEQMPGFTDRNRDLGLRFDLLSITNRRARSAFTGFLTVTNGDGPDLRNVLDELSDDHIAISGRFDWNFGFRSPLGLDGDLRTSRFAEGALDSHAGEFRGGIGAWGYSLHHVSQHDRWLAGVDGHLTWGGLSATGGYCWANFDGSDTQEDFDSSSWYVQVGYLFPGTAFEVAGRTGGYEDSGDFGAVEGALGVNYYVDGWRNRVTLDATRIWSRDEGNVFGAAYPGYLPTGQGDATLLRLQWQLGL